MTRIFFSITTLPLLTTPNNNWHNKTLDRDKKVIKGSWLSSLKEYFAIVPKDLGIWSESLAVLINQFWGQVHLGEVLWAKVGDKFVPSLPVHSLQARHRLMESQDGLGIVQVKGRLQRCQETCWHHLMYIKYSLLVNVKYITCYTKINHQPFNLTGPQTNVYFPSLAKKDKATWLTCVYRNSTNPGGPMSFTPQASVSRRRITKQFFWATGSGNSTAPCTTDINTCNKISTCKLSFSLSQHKQMHEYSTYTLHYQYSTYWSDGFTFMKSEVDSILALILKQ